MTAATNITRRKLKAGHYSYTAFASCGEPGTPDRQHNTASATVQRTDDGWRVDGAGYTGLVVGRLQDAEEMLEIDLPLEAKRGL